MPQWIPFPSNLPDSFSYYTSKGAVPCNCQNAKPTLEYIADSVPCVCPWLIARWNCKSLSKVYEESRMNGENNDSREPDSSGGHGLLLALDRDSNTAALLRHYHFFLFIFAT